MRGDWFSVYLKNHLNFSVAFPSGYLAMSSLLAFRLFSVVQKFGDKVLCFAVETLYVFNRKTFFVHPSSLLCMGCALELFGDRQVAFVLEWSVELVGSLFLRYCRHFRAQPDLE